MHIFQRFVSQLCVLLAVMLWGFQRFQHKLWAYAFQLYCEKKKKKMLLGCSWAHIHKHMMHTHSPKSWVCRVRVCLPGKGLVWESKRQAGRHKVETSLDLAAINSLVICSCLPTLTTLGLGAVWSMGRGARPLWSEVDPSDYALGNCTFSPLSLLWPPLTFSRSFFPLSLRWELEDADGELCDCMPFPHLCFNLIQTIYWKKW